MTHFTDKVAEYPNSQFVTFRFANLGRSSYDASQYKYINTSTGYDSGWNNTPPVSYNGYYSSNFNISLSTGYNYSVYTRLLYNGTWYYGEYDPVSFSFGGRPPQPPLMRHNSSNGKMIYMVIDNYYNATSLSFKPSWQSYRDTYPVGQSTYGFQAPDFGGIYTIGVRGVNADGESDDKLSQVMAEPKIPTINATNISNNEATINVNTEGYFDKITVEMWSDGAASLIISKDISWNGNTNLSSNLTFGGLTPNAKYQFRATVYRSSSSYTPTMGWGGWLKITNTASRPSNWRWTTAQNSNGHKMSGVTYSMLASEWNSFTQRVNEFRKYKGLNDYSFTPSSRGGVFYFYHFNEANNAITSMNSTGLSNVTTGSKVYASYFNALMNSMNGIS